jgi:hypothetical protein
LQRDERRLRGGQLEDERARIVADAAHHVEPSRRARDEDICKRVEERAQFRGRMFSERVERLDERPHVGQFARVAADDFVGGLPPSFPHAR